MTAAEILHQVRSIVSGTNPDLPHAADDQPLFYDAKTSTSEAHKRAGGYGLDSLDAVEIVMELEERFDVEIPDAVMSSEEFRTVGGMARWIAHQKEQG